MAFKDADDPMGLLRLDAEGSRFNSVLAALVVLALDVLEPALLLFGATGVRQNASCTKCE